MSEKYIGSPAAIAAILVVMLAGLVGLNTFTAPLIAANGDAAAYAPLFEVMPEGQGFEAVYQNGVPAEGEDFGEVPPTVTAIYRETSGLGYAVSLSTTEGYTGDPMEITMAVDSDGKICGAAVNTYPETKDMGVDTYPAQFVGQDSTLADIQLVAGVTYSSSAFKNALSDGFTALINGGCVGAGVKGEGQVLMEMLPQVFTGMANGGILQYEELEGSFDKVQSAMVASNGSGVACIAGGEKGTVLAICNVNGGLKIYDAEGNEISDAAVETEVRQIAENNLKPFNDEKKLAKLCGEGAVLTPADISGVFSTVTTAYTVEKEGKTSYAFAARPYGYSNMPMVIYAVIDQNGAIEAMTADELILIKEYFKDYQLDEPSYKAGFVGQTADGWTGELTLISGATVSGNAVNAALTDIFGAADTLIGGDGNE